MADEITHNAAPGLNLYICRFQPNGNVFLTDGSADEVWGTAGRDANDYDVAMTESTVGVSGHYKADFDTSSNIAANAAGKPYKVSAYKRVGGVPADSDIPAIAQGEIEWDGSAEITLSSIPTVTEIWDEVITKANHNVANSAAKKLRQIDVSVTSGTAQGSGTGNNQIQLASGESAVDGMFDPSKIYIQDGTGAGQSRNILQYDGASRTVTVDRNWKINPAADSEYVILADAGREHVNEGLAQAGNASPATITLNTLASSSNTAYKNQYVFIRSGTGEDQVRRITAYNGSTKVATISRAWGVVPDTTSGYVMLPMACVEVQAVTDIELDTKVGSNLNTFFQNAGNDTTEVVDNLSDIASVDEIWAKAMSDLAAGAPSATASVITALNYIYEAWRNKTVTDAPNNEIIVYKDDGTTKLCESDISDNGTLFTKGEYGAPD